MARKKKAEKQADLSPDAAVDPHDGAEPITGAVADVGEPEDLAELTAAELVRLEKKLADEVDLLTEAQAELRDAKQVFKDCRAEVDSRRSDVHLTSRLLREVIRGNWRPPKPDPQQNIPWPEELEQGGGGEAESLWTSKPVTELGLPKTIVRKLEEDGFTTLGIIVGELEEGSQFESLELSETQISKIRSAVFKHGPKVTGGEENEQTPAG